MAQNRVPILDLIRAIAAWLVVVSHVRCFIFQDYASAQPIDLCSKIFYYLTSFGHQAVLIFFVLSGYLVGGSVVASNSDGFWPRYLVQRLSRLWIVLIPSLAITLILNLLGYSTGGSDYLNGMMNPPVFSAPRNNPVSLDALTFLFNISFLQTICAPVFGDNGPLWSLANEFWYYIMFPLFFFGLQHLKPTRNIFRLGYIGLALIILWIIPNSVALGFLMWLFGVVINVINKKQILSFMKTHIFGLLVLGLLMGFLHCSRTGLGGDFFVALLFSLSLPWLINSISLPHWLSKCVAYLSDTSYSLYVFHFSFAAFLWYTFLGSQRFKDSVYAYAWFVLFCVLIFIYTAGVAYAFERNTDIFRRLMMRLVPKRWIGGIDRM